MLLAIIWLIVGFVLLIKGADFLVDGASGIAKRFGVSDIVIGLTIVSMGTSAPELVVSIASAFEGKTGMVYGNVIGSNISNTCLILGVAGLIYPLTVQRNTTFVELPLSLGIVFLVYFLSNDARIWGYDFQPLEDGTVVGGLLSHFDGVILLLCFAGFLYYVFRSAKSDPDGTEIIDPMPVWKSIVYIVGGAVGLILGGDWVVDSAIKIASGYMSDRLIGLTIVAVGTSLPELATSAIAALKKNSDIAIGNVVGSNIFNILLVLGASGAIKQTEYQLAINWDLYFLIGATLLLFAFLFIGTRRKGNLFTLDRWQSGVLLLAIIGYYGYLISTNI
jgi:cation:H+ antiporter